MKILISTVVTRFLIFCFWIAAIASFLLLPALVNKLRSQKSITIFTWPMMLDPIYLKNFERETGIKLYITYFENGPSLLSKIEATRGAGYDLIIPDDHSLAQLIEKGLVKKIDKTQLKFWNNIRPELLGNYADPENNYSIPYYWAMYGIGYDSNQLKESPTDSWSSLFNPNTDGHGHICMTDDAREAVMMTAIYLFGSIDALKDKANVQKIKEALIAQKKFVEVYSISRSDSLLQSKSCLLAMITNPELARLTREHPQFKFIKPREGSMVVVDSMALSAGSDKDALVYEFLNYLYKDEVIRHHIENFGYCSPISTVSSDQEVICSAQTFKDLHFMESVISDDEINQLWIEVLGS